MRVNGEREIAECLLRSMQAPEKPHRKKFLGPAGVCRPNTSIGEHVLLAFSALESTRLRSWARVFASRRIIAPVKPHRSAWEYLLAPRMTARRRRGEEAPSRKVSPHPTYLQGTASTLRIEGPEKPHLCPIPVKNLAFRSRPGCRTSRFRPVKPHLTL